MEILDILREKRETLKKTGNPLAVPFTLDEVNVLGDPDQLRRLKLSLPFPKDFEPSNDLFDCTNRILHDEGDYRVLEFCCLKNRLLIVPVSQVLSKIIKI